MRFTPRHFVGSQYIDIPTVGNTWKHVVTKGDMGMENVVPSRALLVALLAGALGVPFPSAHGAGASFGCKVLLCAAATPPSWSGTPYRVPVMDQLFRDLARGGSWPTCPEAHAGGLGYDPYRPCQSGMTPMQTRADDAQVLVPAPNGNLCADTSKAQRSCWGGDREGSCHTTYPTIPREARGEPNFVDITTANGVQRLYFSLRGC
jgi:hypothetical protein